MRLFSPLFFAFSLAFLAACSTDPKTGVPTENGSENTAKSTAPDSFTLQQFDLKPGAAGFIKVGMRSDSLKALVPARNLKTTERELEGMKYTAYEIRNAQTGNQLLLLAEESCEPRPCHIFRLRIVSPKFKTKEGIRVGSTFGEVQKTYPLSFIGIGETDFVAVSEKQKMTFTLDIAGFPPKELYKIKAEDIPAETPVTSILLF